MMLFFLFLVSSDVFASSGGLPGVVASCLGLPFGFDAIVASAMVLVILWGLGFVFKRSIESETLSKSTEEPGFFGRKSIALWIEVMMEFLDKLYVENIQHPKNNKIFAFISYIFIFILFSNLCGLVPGFPPPTEAFNGNLAMGFGVFLLYHALGIHEHGFGYLKQFTGPFLLLAPLFVVLELISHCARPLSLAFRLSANIFGDHLLLGVFSEMVPIGVPALLMFFGLLVACIQAFVFTMLSIIYIQMALAHDH